MFNIFKRSRKPSPAPSRPRVNGDGSGHGSIPPSINQSKPSQLSSFKKSNKVKDLEELLDDHVESEGPFLYASLGASAPVSRKDILRTIAGRRRLPVTKEIVLDKLPALKLKDWEIELPITDYLPKGWEKKSDDFIQMEELVWNFTPTVGANWEHSEVLFSVQDKRRTVNPVVKSCNALNTQGADTSLSLGYYVAKEDLKYLSFCIDQSNNILREGIVWGSLKIFVKLRTSNVAHVVSDTPVVGQIRVAPSLLQSSSVDPDHMNLLMSQAALDDLKAKAKRNQILDYSKAAGRQDKFLSSTSQAGSDNDSSSSADYSPSKNLVNRVKEYQSTLKPLEEDSSDDEEDTKEIIRKAEEEEENIRLAEYNKRMMEKEEGMVKAGNLVKGKGREISKGAELPGKNVGFRLKDEDGREVSKGFDF
jgi:hypothetical protein